MPHHDPTDLRTDLRRNTAGHVLTSCMTAAARTTRIWPHAALLGHTAGRARDGLAGTLGRSLRRSALSAFGASDIATGRKRARSRNPEPQRLWRTSIDHAAQHRLCQCRRYPIPRSGSDRPRGRARPQQGGGCDPKGARVQRLEDRDARASAASRMVPSARSVEVHALETLYYIVVQ